MSEVSRVDANLELLSQEFAASLPEQWGAIESHWLRVRHEGWASPASDALRRQIHSLTGAAASLGFEQIADSARDLQRLLQDSGSPDPERSAQAEAGLHRLRQAVYARRQIDVAELTRRLVLAKDSSVSLQEERRDRLIYMVEDDPVQAAELAEQVGYFGYCVQAFASPAELEAAIRQAIPTAILMDVSFPEGVMLGYETITALRGKFPELPPIIFVTVNDQTPFRLQAVRVGGAAYFTKPVDVGVLIDVLDRLILHDVYPPSRVLVVDDSRVQANYIAMQLNRAGMKTEIASDPLKAIDHMIVFNPDLVLLDMYMPACTGMELAKVIRQMEQFISVPIVFLSAETDKEKQLAAMGIGGDDFLTKPIEPEHLISAVTTRIERYRRLRALMVQDSLTGLLNHSATKEKLAQELERARRQNLSLSFAMIDLDHFKAVNDTYGHATGDRVLKSLAHMLKQRLRSTDTIGRMGGEEFAVILPEADEASARAVLAELCEGFGKIRHHSGDKEFSISFSCGVACYPDCTGADELVKSADKALYAAKAAGRNQVARASEVGGRAHSGASPRLSKAPPPSGGARAATDQAWMSHAQLAVVRFDKEGRITLANAAAHRLFGYDEGLLVGRPVVGALMAQSEANRRELRNVIAGIASQPERFGSMEAEGVRQRGEPVWVSWSLVPVLDEQGDLAEILGVGNDITDRQRAESDLARTVAYLSALNRISQMVGHEQDLPRIVTEVTGEVARLFAAQHVGVSFLSEDRSTLEFVANSEEGWSEAPGRANRVYLPDDLASQQAVETGQPVFVTEAMTNPRTRGSHSVLRKHGIHRRLVVPLVSRGAALGTMNIDFESAERQVSPADLELAVILAGSIASVIANRQLFSAEQRQREYLEALVGNIPVAVVTIDSQGRIRTWNPAAENLFGYTAAEAMGQAVDDLLASDEYRQEAAGYTQDIFQQGQLVRAVTRRRRKDGSLAEVELLAVPVHLDQAQSASLAIYHDITDLQRARREAETANEAKSAFLATMSHEIRTPLNAIVGMTTLLAETPLTDEQQEFSETIRISSDALLAIINDILDFSKIEAGRMELEEQAFDLRECVESALDLVTAQATEKGIDLAYLIDLDVPPVIIGDSTRLRQILLNLLNNSLKFTDAGEVVLAVSAEKNSQGEGKAFRLHFSVRDTGIGISAAQMDRLFRSFSQLDASTTRKYGGTGLGLAISKRLAELMGGSMWAESEGIPGQGSTFHFVISADQSTSPVPVFMHARQPELNGKRVLIVDDNATNRYILRRQVQTWGMLPQDTAEPRQALQWIEMGRQFDIALLDMQMPDMDGVTLAAEISRRRQNLPDLPMVMLTSLGLREVDSGAAKFAAYLTKPIKPVVLYSTLLKAFGGQPGRLTHRPEPAAIESALGRSAPLRILLAEDTVVNQRVALHLLERIGYRADVAGNGFEVLEALRRQPYDVILMDVQMPEMDGLEATRRVRSGDWLETGGDDAFERQPAIIAMTANAMQGDREICLAAGMDDYISKPIRLEELARALNKAALSRRAASRPAPEPAEEIREESNRPAIDESAFTRFRLSLGEGTPEAAVSLIRDYLEESSVLIEELRRAAALNDLEGMRRSAHSLNASSLLFGALQLADLCKALESGAQGSKLEQASGVLANIEREFGKVGNALARKLSEFDL